MVEVARREHPGFAYEVADLRELPFADASLAGVVRWFSLIYSRRTPGQVRSPSSPGW